MESGQKRITVWVVRASNRKYPNLQWIDPHSGRRRSKSARTDDEKELEIRRADLEAALNTGWFYEPGDSELSRAEEAVKANAENRAGIVYFIRELPRGPIKIGSTKSFRGRSSSLQCGSPRGQELLGVLWGGRPLERDLHDCFRRLRIRGEWFRAAPVLLRFIREHAEPYIPRLHDRAG